MSKAFNQRINSTYNRSFTWCFSLFFFKLKIYLNYNFKVKNDDASATNLKIWTISMDGALNTLYEGEKFSLQFRFDEQYPFSSPEVFFFF